MSNLQKRSVNNIAKSVLNSLKKVVVAGLIGLSLWGFAAPAQAADAGEFYKNERGQLQTTERYDKIQNKSGGMNDFEAVDPRRDANEAKAQALIDTAKRRKAQASDPLEPAREAIDDLKDKAVGTTSDLTTDLTETAKDVSSTLKKAGREIASDLDKTGDDFAENFSKKASQFGA